MIEITESRTCFGYVIYIMLHHNVYQQASSVRHSFLFTSITGPS
jgi:hypothetical protein